MSTLLDLLGSNLGNDLVQGTSQQLGMDKQNAAKAVAAAMPLILGAMKNNASSDEGANSLLGALSNPKHSSGRVMDSLGSILGGSQIDNDVMDDGDKILGHLFGGNKREAADVVGKSSGIDIGQAMNILKIAAPFIMSYLARQKQQRNVSNAGGLGDLLGGLLGNQGGSALNAASLLQTFANNDSTIDDIAGMVLGGGSGKSSSGGIGDLLGGIFGGR